MADPTPTSTRRHDLDALRSFAMLLGIVLHAALAYVGAGWMVTDDRTSPLLGLTIPAIHGFRMPLFFLLSGFFSAMLWHRKGLASLLSQRTKRILLPLVLACLTILPAMWLVTRWAVSENSALIRETAAERKTRERAPTSDIWTVAAYGDMEGLRAFAAGSELLDKPDPTFGVTPLGWTAIGDTPEATEYLLSIGASPSARYVDGNTPLHTACFFGRAEVAQRLLRAGADTTIASAIGDAPAAAMRHPQQTVEYIANMLKVPVDFPKVVEGRERIRQMLEAAPLAQSKGAAATAAPDSAVAESASPIARLQNEPFFHHLWFLWFLCWLNAGFAVVVAVLSHLPKIRVPAVLLSSPACLLWLVPVTLLTQIQMQAGGTTPGFGPDTSAGLVPMPHVLLYYATFFAFGAMMHAVRGSEARFGRLWAVMLPLGLLLLPVGLMFGFQDPQAAAWVPDEEARRWVSALLQVLYAWLMTLGVLGLFESWLAKPRPWVRYLSDSSYWLYLVHLPVIIAGQALLLRTDLHPVLEFAVLTLTVTAALLLTYHLAVRRTPIGTLLNGTRTRPTQS